MLLFDALPRLFPFARLAPLWQPLLRRFAFAQRLSSLLRPFSEPWLPLSPQLLLWPLLQQYAHGVLRGLVYAIRLPSRAALPARAPLAQRSWQGGPAPIQRRLLPVPLRPQTK